MHIYMCTVCCVCMLPYIHELRTDHLGLENLSELFVPVNSHWLLVVLHLWVRPGIFPVHAGMLTGVVLYRSCVGSRIVKVSWRSFPVTLRGYRLEVGVLVLRVLQTFCPSSAMYLSLAEYPQSLSLHVLAWWDLYKRFHKLRRNLFNEVRAALRCGGKGKLRI